MSDLTPITDEIVRDVLSPYNRTVYSLIQIAILIVVTVLYVKLIRKRFFKKKIYTYQSIMIEKKQKDKNISEKKLAKLNKKSEKLEKWNSSGCRPLALILTALCILMFINSSMFRHGIYSKISGEPEWHIQTATVDTVVTDVEIPQNEKGEYQYTDAKINYFIFFTDFPNQRVPLHDEDFFIKGNEVYVVLNDNNQILEYFNSSKYSYQDKEE